MSEPKMLGHCRYCGIGVAVGDGVQSKDLTIHILLAHPDLPMPDYRPREENDDAG